MQIFVIKRALSRGIEEMTAGESDKNGCVELCNATWNKFLPPSAFRRTLAEALEASERMRQRKIKSLKRQLAKYETMRFVGTAK